MPTDPATILITPLILGVIEALKRAGLVKPRYAALVSLALGVAVTLGSFLAVGVGARDVADAILQGIAFGLAASGLYSVARTAERSVRGVGVIAEGREVRR